MSMPVRLQLSRRRGFNLQAWSREFNGLDAVNVSRPSQFGNPFVVGESVDKRQAKRWGWWPLANPDFVAPDAGTAIRRFQVCLALDEAIHDHVRRELRGKNLACWCALYEPCHADFLIELANK